MGTPYAVDTPVSSKSIVGVDPGAISGVAAVSEGVLWLVAAIKPEDVALAQMVGGRLKTCRTLHLVWERPQIYGRKKTPNPASLITTSFRAGLLIGTLRSEARIKRTLDVLPREWKGQVPKEIHNKRTLDALSEHERGLIESCKFTKGQLDDVLDAVGIAKWAYEKGGARFDT